MPNTQIVYFSANGERLSSAITGESSRRLQPFSDDDLRYYAGLLTQVDPSSDSPVKLGCVDKDDPHPDCEVLDSQDPYLQYPGGIDGLATMYGAGLEAEHPGAIKELGLGVHLLGHAVAEELRRAGIEPVLHSGCKKIIHRQALIEGAAMASHDQVKTVHPNVESAMHERIMAAHLVIHSSGLLLPAENVYADLAESPAGNDGRVKVARLTPTPDTDRLVIANTPYATTLKAFRRPDDAHGAFLSTLSAAVELTHQASYGLSNEGMPKVSIEALYAAAAAEHVALAHQVGLGRVAILSA